MPIFARTKLIIQDDCWDISGPEMKWSYSGPNPHLAYKKIKDMFFTVWNVKEHERVQEKEFVWDREGKKEKFSVSWELSKDMDRFTYIYARISINGEAIETENGKEGKLNVNIDGVLRTEYPQDTLWERSIFYEMARVFWHKVLYQEQRRLYQDNCRRLMKIFLEELKAFFNLLPKMM